MPFQPAERFLDGDRHEKLPEVHPVAELLKSALGRPCAEAVKGAQRHILGIIDRRMSSSLKAAASDRDRPDRSTAARGRQPPRAAPL